MGELILPFHKHKVILNEAELAEPVVGKDAQCTVCRLPINKLIDTFYRCTDSLMNSSSSSECVGFFIHKTCSELPFTIPHPMKPQHPLSLFAIPNRKLAFCVCSACKGDFQGFGYWSGDFFVCLRCVTSILKSLEDRSRCHPGHNHPLTLVQSPALFLCHACNTTATDLSYICTKCCFWMHKSCANAPNTYQSKFHNQHPLSLAYSIPQEFRAFPWDCSICDKYIYTNNWVYYCTNCRFFVHMKCSSSTEMLSKNDINNEAEESNLMHFPAPDEASLNEMMQQCIMKATNALVLTTAEPSPHINYWGHKHQPLTLRNKNAKTWTHESNWKLADTDLLLICDGCTKPISLVDDIFYECISCSFFLHISCAQFPKEFEHHLAGKLDGILKREINKLDHFRCRCCLTFSNGISMYNKTGSFDIWCASLPRIIKHEGHPHPLNQLKSPGDYVCKACWSKYSTKETIYMFGCEKCEFCIHIWCALRPHMVKHRWDPHPLYLILFPKDVADHPHEYQCESCSEQINPNAWFYHCNVCDLSFHSPCIDLYNWQLSNMKYGATNIYSKMHPHSHGLTLVQNKKWRSCNKCGEKIDFGLSVLECSPCKYTVHLYC